MPDRFLVVGSGRCGTKYLSELLTAAGVPCGHERVYNPHNAGVWPADLQADSSWMAVPHLPAAGLPVVLLVRHPLAVVRSWVEIGFFSHHDAANPTHGPLRAFAPHVYTYETPANRALAMWLALNRAALARAEAVLRLEHFNASQLARLLRWAGVSDAGALAAFRRVGRTNRHESMRQRVRVSHEPQWSAYDTHLSTQAARLAVLLGYDPEEVPGG